MTRSYRNCNNCYNTQLTPDHIYSCPAILTTLYMTDINPEEDIHTVPQLAGCTDRSDLLHGHDTSVGRYCDQGTWTDLICFIDKTPQLAGIVIRDANSAAPVDLSLAAIPTSNAAAQVRRNWADITEEVNPGAEEGFTLVQGRKRRRGSANSPTAAAPSSNPGGSRTIRRPQPSAGSVPRAQEIRVTRAHIAEARARQASSSEEHCVYIEHRPRTGALPLP
ncbi:hypothetical protein LAZ67_1002065 [Cordylochernes scorpioides]|uniref:Uncharacterized protein n=1 Tax=Cordylochernes scorpioides TaxID=51811 RepID=A0ABY6JXF9_9ARAC|nr:hypothetical protein LAZ67_1002065 [Cordylochernes scorpioides]